jgi:hypothetical protein
MRFSKKWAAALVIVAAGGYYTMTWFAHEADVGNGGTEGWYGDGRKGGRDGTGPSPAQLVPGAARIRAPAIITTTMPATPAATTTTTTRPLCLLRNDPPKAVGTRMRSAVQAHPMQGWMSWAEYQCETNCNKENTRCIDENLFLHVAKEFVRLGLKDAGYTYIWIDDCWMLRTRTEKGIEADPERFPHGIAWLAEQLHTMGLKLGIYLNNGKWTCQHYAGSEGTLAQDVATIAGWKVDGLKLDGCYMSMPTFNRVNDSYAEASAAIRASGRDMVFICSYPYYEKFGGGMAGPSASCFFLSPPVSHGPRGCGRVASKCTSSVHLANIKGWHAGGAIPHHPEFGHLVIRTGYEFTPL